MKTPDTKCEVCDKPLARWGKRCLRCRRIHDNVSSDSRSDVNAITEAMRTAFRDDKFYCYYTGIELDTENDQAPNYRSIDHRTPGVRDDLVLCCMFVNEMKSDLDEEEFRTAVIELAKCFQTNQPLDMDRLSFRHRKRHWQGKPKE